MADSPLDRFRRPLAKSEEAEPFERHMEAPAVMLDLVLRGGDRLGLPYAYLTALRLDASQSLELEYPSRNVVIRGRNLGPLYNSLLVHLVRRIAVAETEFDDGSAGTWIGAIEIKEAEAQDN